MFTLKVLVYFSTGNILVSEDDGERRENPALWHVLQGFGRPNFKEAVTKNINKDQKSSSIKC
jgi:hypothetical protein